MLIQLSQGMQATVSPQDFPAINAFRWHVVRNGGQRKHIYAARTESGTGRRIYMHRAIAGVDGLMVDHINGDGLDNRRENLRAATRSQNASNLHCAVRSSSGKRGVFEYKDGFVSKVIRNGEKFYLGVYPTAEAGEAARTRFLESDSCLTERSRLCVIDALLASHEQRIAELHSERLDIERVIELRLFRQLRSGS